MSHNKPRGCVLALAFTALLWTSGCVVMDTPDKVEQVQETNDPFEPMNRYFFDLNIFLDEIVLKPMAAWYNAALPQPAQDAVHKFLANIRLPWTAVNDFFQGNPQRAGEAVTRFAINSTVGVAGLFDVATGWGFPQHEEDLGQTLAVMGLPDSPYLVLPLFGPSNPRDAIGMLGDVKLDPVNVLITNRSENIKFPPADHDRYTWVPGARGLGEAIDGQVRNGQAIDDLKRQSMDFYATVRSVYRQRRDAQIHNRGEDESTYPQPRLTMSPAGMHPLQVPPLPQQSATKPAQE